MKRHRKSWKERETLREKKRKTEVKKSKKYIIIKRDTQMS